MIGEYLELKEKQMSGQATSVKVEFVAGLTTFITMAYIIFVNPSILSLEGIPAEGIERMDKQALIAVTCIVSAVATIIVGVFAKAPIAMAPGMGLNAFFAYSLVLERKVNWETALGVVFLSGLLFLILTFLGLRRKLVEAIPSSLISAISVGIGLFITFIGLKNLGVIVQGSAATLVKAGELRGTVLIGLCGLIAMIFLEMKKVKGSLLIGIVFSTVLAAVFGYIPQPTEWISLHLDIRPVAFRLDILGALKWSTGLAFGFVSFALIKIVSGKARDVKPAMWVIAVLSLLFLTLEQLPDMIGYLRSLM